MENELKSYMSNVDEVVSLLKQKIERIEKERNEWKAKYDELHTKYDNILATESGHESKTENVWQSGYAAGRDAGTEKRITAAAERIADKLMVIVRKQLGLDQPLSPELFQETLDESAAGREDVDPQELWDEFSQYIEDDVSSLQIVAGSSVMTESDFKKAFAKFKQQKTKT